MLFYCATLRVACHAVIFFLITKANAVIFAFHVTLIEHLSFELTAMFNSVVHQQCIVAV